MIVELRGQSVLLDSDIAVIYGVSTRDINKAVANNPDKFPAGYVVELSKPEKIELVENFHRFNKLKHSTVNPKAFPEKGLYMLATILKSPQINGDILGNCGAIHKVSPFICGWQSSRLSQKSDSYQEVFRSCRMLKIKLIRRHSCREAEN